MKVSGDEMFPLVPVRVTVLVPTGVPLLPDPPEETPVPVRLAVCGLPDALSWIVSVPVSVPADVGVKVT